MSELFSISPTFSIVAAGFALYAWLASSERMTALCFILAGACYATALILAFLGS